MSGLNFALWNFDWQKALWVNLVGTKAVVVCSDVLTRWWWPTNTKLWLDCYSKLVGMMVSSDVSLEGLGRNAMKSDCSSFNQEYNVVVESLVEVVPVWLVCLQMWPLWRRSCLFGIQLERPNLPSWQFSSRKCFNWTLSRKILRICLKIAMKTKTPIKTKVKQRNF